MRYDPSQSHKSYTPDGPFLYSEGKGKMVALHTLESGDVWVCEQNQDGNWMTSCKATPEIIDLFNRHGSLSLFLVTMI